MSKFARIFIVVMDSVGFGSLPDAKDYGDEGANTIEHIGANLPDGLKLPCLGELGVGDIAHIKGVEQVVEHPQSYVTTLLEESNGKDTMTGHWEMMGILTTKPFKTFTDTGFPQALIDELATRTGHKILGNYSASGTEIIKELGPQQMTENALIVYTSADSVLQIAAHEGVTGLPELYRCCEIAREICMRPEYLLGRVIARPFVGTDPSNFKRTSNRHDYALSPSKTTVMDILKEHHHDVLCVGKIYDIFNGQGATQTQKTVSNQDGMEKTIEIIKHHSFNGLCFVNLVEFDSEFGHRRNVPGYAKALEEFDVQLKTLLANAKPTDLIIITADHGNDPTWKGTDHTRERVPFIAYSPAFAHGNKIPTRHSFADIGATILRNFHLPATEIEIGTPIEELLKSDA